MGSMQAPGLCACPTLHWMSPPLDEKHGALDFVRNVPRTEYAVTVKPKRGIEME